MRSCKWVLFHGNRCQQRVLNRRICLPREEVPQVDELAVLFIFDIHNTPSVLASADGLAIDDDIAL